MVEKTIRKEKKKIGIKNSGTATCLT